MFLSVLSSRQSNLTQHSYAKVTALFEITSLAYFVSMRQITVLNSRIAHNFATARFVLHKSSVMALAANFAEAINIELPPKNWYARRSLLTQLFGFLMLIPVVAPGFQGII